MKIRIKLAEILETQNMTQKQLADITGIKISIISALSNNQCRTIKKEYLEKIADALDIDDINEMLTIVKE